MTKKLYYQDSYLQEFCGKVIACNEKTNDIGDRFYEIQLDQTAFFPESGGQYGDQGWLDDVEVQDTYESDHLIFHRVNKPIEVGRDVTGKINWRLRFDRMQQHSAEHIVSGLVNSTYGYDNVGFHLGHEDSTLDFNGEISSEQLQELEKRANEVAVKNLEIQEMWPDRETLETLTFRSKKELNEAVRIITVPGYDNCACCAPQLRKTGEIGLIKLTGIMRYKGGVRLTMLCGLLALEDYGRKEFIVKNLSHRLSAPEVEIIQGVFLLEEQINALKIQKNELEKKILENKVNNLDSSESNVCLFENDLTGDNPRYLMNLVLSKGKELCGVFFRDEGNIRKSSSGDIETPKEGELISQAGIEPKDSGYKYFVGSSKIDVRPIGKNLNDAFQGRGGGKAQMVQGYIRGNQDEITRWWIENTHRDS